MQQKPAVSVFRNELFLPSAIILTGFVLRLIFWISTNSTLEDAFITFRYAHNLATGNGFVYNIGAHVLGTSTPLWTLLLAAANMLGGADAVICSKITGLLLDSLTSAILFLTLRKLTNKNIALISALLFATSPDLIMISTSGMEYSLVMLSMMLAIRGLAERSYSFSLGIALAILTRMDAAIFAVCLIIPALMLHRKWALQQLMMIILLTLPWFIFSQLYFGSLLPHSYLAKRTVYNFGRIESFMPFVSAFTPFADSGFVKIISKGLFFILLLTGILNILRQHTKLTPAAAFFFSYCIIFSISGMMIFRWYLVPAVFISVMLTASGIGLLSRFAARMVRPFKEKPVLLLIVSAIVCMNLFVLNSRIEKYSQQQLFENEVRKEIGTWLKNNTRQNSSVFLEPIGYVGFFSGIKIFDEIGLVTPEVVSIRKNEDQWYIKAIKKLNPDYILQYKASIDSNTSEGSGTRLFGTENEKKWFSEYYRPLRIFAARGDYPLIEDKEKEYILYQRSGKNRQGDISR